MARKKIIIDGEEQMDRGEYTPMPCRWRCPLDCLNLDFVYGPRNDGIHICHTWGWIETDDRGKITKANTRRVNFDGNKCERYRPKKAPEPPKVWRQTTIWDFLGE